MKRCAQLAALCVLSLSTVVWGAPGAHAVENEIFGITPQPERVNNDDRNGFSIPLDSGATFEDSIRIYNRTDQRLEVEIYAVDASPGADTQVTVDPRDAEPQGVGAWIDLPEDELTLAGRAEMSITFRVEVESADPSPAVGAIVVEPTGQSVAQESDSNRLSLLVRTAPAESPSTSVRVRPLLLRSPWIIVASIGLLVALIVIFIGTRRARRPKDSVVPAGDIEPVEDEQDSVPEASRPVIKRLGERPDEGRPGSRTGEVPVVERQRRSTTVRTIEDDRPFLDDDMLVEVDDVEDGIDFDHDDEDEDEDLPPARSRPAPSRSRQPARSVQPSRKATSAKPKATAKSKAAKTTSRAKPKPKKVVRKPAKKAQPPRGFIPLDDV
ncbi:MAG: hypothetical protein WD646_04170 [Actinomycetota bacterium]